MASNTDGAESLVRRMAAWANDIRSVPDAALRQARLLIVDCIACGIAARDEDLSQTVLALVRDQGGAPQCTLIGTAERTSLLQAVLANGVLVRALDLNDYVDRDHPSDNIPAALAVGQWVNSSMGDLLSAIVIGYELYGRMKQLIPGNGAWDGTTSSGAVVAVMAGRLMRLDGEQMAHALGLSLARSPTSALARFGAISSLKALANPMVAQTAVQACLLARHGATGPMGLFESRRGLQGVFSEQQAMTGLLAPFPAESYIMRANVKRYPALVTGQAVVAAALALRAQLGPEAEDLAAVDIVMADTPAVRIQQEDRERWDPRSREAADHCFQFLAAVALIDGEFGLAQYDSERWNDPRVRALMSRMTLGRDPDLSRRAPSGAYPCALHAIDRSGGEYRTEALAPPGFSRGGLSESDVVEKFRNLTAPRLSVVHQDAIVEAALCGAGGSAAIFEALESPFVAVPARNN